MMNPPPLTPCQAPPTNQSLPQLEPPPTSPTVVLQEVFSSFQGEGPWVGKRQLFVRFAHCHLTCRYCDTAMESADGRAHITQPNGTLVSLDNPLTAGQLTQALLTCLQQQPHHSVSFTGGEPLLYHKALRQILPAIQPVCKTYLETSGTQPDWLKPLLPWTDMVAMDVKLPSATGEPGQWLAHAEFLRLSLQTQVFIKVVFNNDLTAEELDQVAQLARISRSVPVILQPETSLTAAPQLNASEQTMFCAAERLQAVFDDVRLIPQTHKMVSIR
jgi:7-carboxy-7-deazaguanine synthase